MTFVDHNYGGADAMSFQEPRGKGIPRATIRVFTKDDWDKGNRANKYAVGKSATTTNGKWLRAIPLEPGRYVVVFLSDSYEPAVAEFEVV